MMSGQYVCLCLGHMDQAVVPLPSLLSWMELRARRAELECNQSLTLFVSLLCPEFTARASKSPLPALPHCCDLPWLLTSLGQEVKVQRVSSRKGKPIIIIFTAPQHQISLCCAPVGLHCQYRFSCTSSEADGLQTAISWTPAPSYKLQAFLLVITDIN